MSLLFDPLFRLPFATGLLLALVLALLGCFLRLRNEWLAALGYTQLAAAGGILGALAGLPVTAAAVALAGAGAAIKGLLRQPGNDHYVVLLLLGWALTLLGGAALHHGEGLAQTLLHGNLYFTGTGHFLGLLGVGTALLVLLPWLSPRLLTERFFPDHFSANRIPAWRHVLVFDLLVVLAVALGATAVGVMAVFALVFIPPWVAFHLARGWREALLLAPALALGAYLAAFAVALLADLPFGPVLVATLLLLAPLRAIR